MTRDSRPAESLAPLGFQRHDHYACVDQLPGPVPGIRERKRISMLARIIDAHHAMPCVRVWGSAERTSLDGQFFPSGRSSGQTNPKYRVDPGLKTYSFLSGQWGPFDANVIGATSGKVHSVLDGLVGNAAQFNLLVRHVDTGGVIVALLALPVVRDLLSALS